MVFPRSTLTRRWIAVPMAMIALLLASACGDDDATVLEELEDQGTAETFVGQQLSVNGEVGDVISPRAFVIGGDFADLAEEGTLVVGAEDVGVEEGDVVQVTGEVFEVSASDVAREGVEEFEGRFAIRARTIDVVSEEAIEREPRLDDAAVGDTVTVGGRVDAIVEAYAFRIADPLDPGDGLLVIDPQRTFVSVGGTAEVSGTVQTFQLEEIEAMLGAELDEEAFDQVVDEGDRIVVADSVEFVPED